MRHVVAVHDLHASTVSTGMPILMAHVVVEQGLTMEDSARILSQLQDCLREHFPVSIPHTTFQLEPEGYSSASRPQMHSYTAGESTAVSGWSGMMDSDLTKNGDDFAHDFGMCAVNG